MYRSGDMCDDDKDGDNDNRKNNVVDNGDENEDGDKLNVSLGFLPFLIRMVMKTGQTHCGRRQ